MEFEFATARRIVFGAKSVSKAGQIAAELGRRALVVTGGSRRRAEGLIELLHGSGVEATVFQVPGEPEIETVRNGAAIAKGDRCDLVIGIGGGSVIDAGKAVAAMLTNEGDVLDYLEIIGRGKALAKASAPFIAIPTTAGTGAEVTRNAVLGSPEHRVKVSLRSPSMLPAVALVDPELTRDLPQPMTASTGLDALTQLIEPYVCLRANPMTDALCEDGVRRVARWLRVAWSDGGNLVAREGMCHASLYGGLALANAGLGAVHGLAGPIGGMFRAPHGAVCAALLPHVMEANLAAVRSRGGGGPAALRYETVARLLTGNASATADVGVEWVRELVAELQIPGLATYGITEAYTAEIVEKSSRASSMKANPIVLTSAELADVLARAL